MATPRPAPRGGRPVALRDAARAAAERACYRQELRRLLELGPHLIDDIGLTLEEARSEAAKPLWRPYEPARVSVGEGWWMWGVGRD
jgi:uncharacterized protein YjiS (DUF1127 family)